MCIAARHVSVNVSVCGPRIDLWTDFENENTSNIAKQENGRMNFRDWQGEW